MVGKGAGVNRRKQGKWKKGGGLWFSPHHVSARKKDSHPPRLFSRCWCDTGGGSGDDESSTGVQGTYR